MRLRILLPPEVADSGCATVKLVISLDGAALIPQIYVVAILILAVERRAIGPVPYPGSRTLRGQVGWWFGFAAVGLTLGAAVIAVVLCVMAVSSGVPLKGADAVFVTTTGFALALLALGQVIPLGMRAYAGASKPE